ncbi:MAG: YdcF family protein [Planctomycetes bacterium]|nr:YdcF family protein [Planctomycetota bacterium]
MAERPSTFKRLLKRALIGSSLLVLGLFGWVLFGGGIESSEPADCIVVPGAAVWRNRTPSDALLYRLQKAAELYRQGRAPMVIVTGGGEGNYAEGEVMCDWLAEHGVPRSAIIVENQSSTTRDSGINVATLMHARGFRSALVVSQWFHVARARLCLEQQGVQTHAAPSGGNTLVKEPYFVAREMLALPAYALRLDELR